MTWVLPFSVMTLGCIQSLNIGVKFYYLFHSWKWYQGVYVTLVIILLTHLLKEKAPAWAINSTIVFPCGDINFLDHEFSFNVSSTKHIINLED